MKFSSKKEMLSAHDNEHKQWNRRSFVQALGLVGGGSMMLGGASLNASAPSPLAAALSNAENGDRVLVLIRLKGGNDGLNTIVPIYDYDTYASKRQSIRIEKNKLYNLSPDFGISDYMKPLQRMWGDGEFKVVHGVGYNEQNLSHFRSSDIWASAVDDKIEKKGVLGKYFENIYPDYLVNLPEIPPAIQIGSIGNSLLKAGDINYSLLVSNPEQLSKIAKNGTLHDVTNVPDCTYGDQLNYMRAVANTTFKYATTINKAYEKSTNDVEYGNKNLASQLSIIARMIKGNLGTKIYLVTLDGFDTHANQSLDHQNLMTDLTDSISNFYEDLASAGMAENVLSMTFSEFGRRISENGSQGTDHGAAAPALLFGPALNENGFIGKHPDLNDPEGPGNLKADIDFRRLYATVLKEWLCIDSNLVDSLLLQGSYQTLPLGFNCKTLSSDSFGAIDPFKHVATYDGENTYLELQVANTEHMDIKLYDIVGKEIGTLKNGITTPGAYKINIKNELKQSLMAGQYIYRIVTNRQKYSRSIMIK